MCVASRCVVLCGATSCGVVVFCGRIGLSCGVAFFLVCVFVGRVVWVVWCRVGCVRFCGFCVLFGVVRCCVVSCGVVFVSCGVRFCGVAFFLSCGSCGVVGPRPCVVPVLDFCLKYSLS